ncbi:hypothetical protein HK102_013307 [Quaeritorhiza haematococci]|nr:hypothetical protein HK102_013307 [Quaeritorhiza haematococci]
MVAMLTKSWLLLPYNLYIQDHRVVIAGFKASARLNSKQAQPIQSLFDDRRAIQTMLDLVVVGAGPHGLSLTARLFETLPDSVVNENEHSRWAFQQQRRQKKKNYAKKHQRSGRTSPVERLPTPESDEEDDGEADDRDLLLLSSLQQITPTLESSDDESESESEDGESESGSVRRGLDLTSIRVIDDAAAAAVKNGKKGHGWMSRWNNQFTGYGIEWLRSPLFFHPDPSDVDSLRAYADQHGRIDELRDIDELFERKYSSCREKRFRQNAVFNERIRNRFVIPTSALFWDFCQNVVVSRYASQTQSQLTNDDICSKPSLLMGGKVLRIDPVFDEHHSNSDTDVDANAPTTQKPITHFDLTVSNNIKIQARRVVVAIGSTNIRNIPDWVKRLEAGSYPADSLVHSLDLVESEASRGTKGAETSECCKSVSQDVAEKEEPKKSNTRRPRRPRRHQPHQQDLPKPKEQPSASSAIMPSVAVKKARTIMIVGGGLTSAHLVSKAVKSGYEKVILVSRSHLKVKWFDADLQWVGRFGNVHHAEFYAEDDFEKRLKILKEARNGGSITPDAKSKLDSLQACGILECYAPCQVESAQYIKHDTTTVTGGEGKGCGGWNVRLDNGIAFEEVEKVWLATGSTVDVRKEPVFKGLLEKVPVPVVGGLPVVNPDLRWARGCEVYLMGAYAALQLGPMALNLMGAKMGSERIAEAILE